MSQNKNISNMSDDWFFEMAASSYCDSLYQELKSQPETPVTPEESAVCDRIWKKIQKGIPEVLLDAHWQKMRPVCLKVGNVAAAIILTATITFSTAFITVEAFRTKILELVYKQYPRYTEINVTKNMPWTQNIYKPTAIPAGYTVLEETKTDSFYIISYKDNDGGIIQFVQRPLSGGGNYNTENGTVETVNVSGQEFVLIEVPGQRSIVWNNDEALFDLWCRVPETATTGQDTEGPLSLEELVDIANSIELAK